MLFIKDLPDAFFKYWIHLYEEDKEDKKIFHPSSYNFPRSRGRQGFEFKKNGDLIFYGIGPTDKVQEQKGYWKIDEENKIKIAFDDPKLRTYTFTILSCDENILKVKNLKI